MWFDCLHWLSKYRLAAEYIGVDTSTYILVLTYIYIGILVYWYIYIGIGIYIGVDIWSALVGTFI